jgi:hypothetical protein
MTAARCGYSLYCVCFFARVGNALEKGEVRHATKGNAKKERDREQFDALLFGEELVRGCGVWLTAKGSTCVCLDRSGENKNGPAKERKKKMRGRDASSG